MKSDRKLAKVISKLAVVSNFENRLGAVIDVLGPPFNRSETEFKRQRNV